MDYLDFVIEIGASAGDDSSRPVEVVSSPAGEARGTLRMPLGKLELENRLQALQIALLRAGSGRRRIASLEEQTVQAFGQELFGALFRDEILSSFDVSRHDAHLQGKGLRIKLRFDDATLAGLPWEYLYDGRQADYLSRSLSTPLVRSIELPRPIEPLTVTPPLRILALVASPSDMDPLDVEHERRRVEDALATLEGEGRVELVWLEKPTWEKLQRALHKGPWHIFHFIGHGGYDPEVDEGVIVLANDSGGSHRLPAAQLGALLGDHFAMRLAFLNSCEGARGGATDIFSSTAAALVRRGTPAVVAMQYEVTDGAAIQFSRSFYTAVADGLPVDASVSAARMGVWLADASSLEWGTPVLYMRARDGALFRIDEQARPAVDRASAAAGVVAPSPGAAAPAAATASPEQAPAATPSAAPTPASAELVRSADSAPSVGSADEEAARSAGSAASAGSASSAGSPTPLSVSPAPAPGADLLGRGVGAAWRWGQQAAAAAREAARGPGPPVDVDWAHSAGPVPSPASAQLSSTAAGPGASEGPSTAALAGASAPPPTALPGTAPPAPEDTARVTADPTRSQPSNASMPPATSDSVTTESASADQAPRKENRSVGGLGGGSAAMRVRVRRASAALPPKPPPDPIQPARAPASRLMFCTDCGSKRGEGIRFCTNCGHALD